MQRGYIALARSFINDLRFRRPANRPLTEAEATIWLIGEVAWKPRGMPTRFGAIHNERTELSTTQRNLAREWNWSKSKVHRFLHEMQREGMISLGLRRCGPKTEPQFGYARSLITLCNYDKFQSPRRDARNVADQKVDQSMPELPGLIYAVATQPLKPTTESFKKESIKPSATIHKDRPRHGQRAKDLIFCWYESDDWQQYARDYETMRGTAIAPSRYRNGWGKWFVAAGEAARRMA